MAGLGLAGVRLLREIYIHIYVYLYVYLDL